MPLTQADLDKRFDYHPPSRSDVADRHEKVRQACKGAAAVLADMVPEGRELSMALTDLENAMMHGNAGIARNQ